ncbi:alpha/beta hydrolase [Streptomyces sp. P1-3]|uniref:alpha/beta hydrolase n=1 Tax=Streptomyces sp. P1-3 TaxID=3421658 RepID=UPI003D36366C
MGMVLADPNMLDRLAKSLDSKAEQITQLKTRATGLDVGSSVTGLTALATWLSDTARDLRRRAGILRSPSESPFGSLSAFGLPTGLAKKDGAGAKLAKELQSVLDRQKGATPKERAQAVKDYFASLSPEQQAALAAAKPNLVGNLDGVPVNVRFAANRISIQKEYEEESAYLKKLPKDHPAFKRTQARVEALRGFMSPRVKTIIDPKTNKPVQVEVPRQFLVFDAHFGSTADSKASPFPDGRVAEVVGDLENAKNVAFRVPGITNRLDNFDGFSSGGYELVKDGKTERADTAVVSWLGYDTPEIGDSVDPAKALVGGERLNAFRQGISVNLQPDAKVNIFAHSYGTLVTSKALQKGMKNVDTVVFMGSPGLGPNINSVADFHMPNTKFYAMRAPEDPVSYTQGHGKDPADFKDITRLSTENATGHSMYYNAGTGSLANLQKVLFDGGKRLTFTHTTLDEEMTGATEMRELVEFLHSKVPPDVVTKMGGELDPIVQDIMSGRIGITDAIRPLNSVLNKYNMLDRVEPEKLKDELVRLSGNLAYKEAYKAAKAKGAPDWVATAAANTAKFASVKLLNAATWPVVKALEINRLQNNVRQLLGGLGEQGGRIVDDTVQIAGSAKNASINIAGNTLDTLRHPTHIFKNTEASWKEVEDFGDTVVNKGGDIVDATVDGGKVLWDKGGDALDTTIDIFNPLD